MQGCFDALFVWIPAIVCASVIERMYDWSPASISRPHSVTIVSVVIERMYDWSAVGGVKNSHHVQVSVVIERMYDWSWWKSHRFRYRSDVSVVIERMYDWSSETNWLKINDFWQLVSGLFFENGRSAQKVPLFSKIWGDCLTVFDSCGNI